MIWIILIIIAYILGVIKCRKAMIEDGMADDFMDVIVCLLPFAHWVMFAVIQLGNSDICSNLADKFFGRKK